MNNRKMRYIHTSQYTKYELVICAIVAAILTVSFTFVYDLAHTSNCSLAYLYGHISDFYDYNVNQRGTGTIVYYPTIYILYAIWNIPVRILGIEAITGNDAWLLIWEKGLGMVFLAIVYFLTYKISLKITNNETAARNSLVALWGGIPVFLLFEFSWGLYDTIWIAFLLAGIYFFLKETSKRSVFKGLIFFAIALTLKTFVLFLIVPILCYRIKKVSHLIGSGLVVISLYLIETLAYWQSDYFVNNVLSPLDGSFLINALFGVSLGRFSVFLLVFIVAMLYEYYIDSSKENDFEGYIIIPFVVAAMFGVLSQQTPGWIIMCMPFYAILIARLCKKDRKLFYLANILLSVGELIYILFTRSFAYGESTLAAGVFGDTIFKNDTAYDYVLCRSSEFFTAELYTKPFGGLMINFGTTFMMAVLLFACVFFVVKNKKGELNFVEKIDKSERKFMYGCCAIVLILYIAPIIYGSVRLNREIIPPTDTTVETTAPTGELTGDIHCSIDYCNEMSVLETQEYTISDTDDAIVLEGWSGYIPTLETTDFIEVVCDEKTYDATVGIERADVAENMKSEALLNSGWSVEIPLEEALADEDGLIQICVHKGDFYNNFTFKINK